MRCKKVPKNKNKTNSTDAFSEAIYPSNISKPCIDTTFIRKELEKRKPSEIKEKTYISVPEQCKLSYTYRPQTLQTITPYRQPNNRENQSNFTIICMGETTSASFVHRNYHIPKLPTKLASKPANKLQTARTARSTISRSTEKPFERLFESSLQTSRGSIQSRDYTFDYEGGIPNDIVNSEDIHSFLVFNKKTIPLQASITPK